jgi:glycosyltransferase involved in cell wall biosynthesis
VEEKPLVSVRIITYNHEKYIEKCLEGILMQRTLFPFEVIVGEHSSTDRTQEIVLAYQKKYPDKIRVFITAREKSPMQNVLQVQQACQGKYQAYCEGDDYWIDPQKLQKQVDFMEAHPDVTLCFHNAFVTRENMFDVRICFVGRMKEILDFDDVLLMSIPTASLVGRSIVLNTLPDWRVKILNNDRLIRLWCAHHGPLGYINDVMSVYRKHAGGMINNMKNLYKERYSSSVLLCQEFDKATQYQHTKQLRVFVKRALEYRQRAQWGRIYYLLHPNQSIAKLKGICRAIKRR